MDPKRRESTNLIVNKTPIGAAPSHLMCVGLPEARGQGWNTGPLCQLIH